MTTYYIIIVYKLTSISASRSTADIVVLRLRCTKRDVEWIRRDVDVWLARTSLYRFNWAFITIGHRRRCRRYTITHLMIVVLFVCRRRRHRHRRRRACH